MRPIIEPNCIDFFPLVFFLNFLRRLFEDTCVKLVCRETSLKPTKMMFSKYNSTATSKKKNPKRIFFNTAARTEMKPSILEAINLYGNERGKNLSMSVTCITEERTGRRGTRGTGKQGRVKRRLAAAGAGWKRGKQEAYRLDVEAA